MRWQEFELLEQVGLTLYERKALITLMIHGVADAGTLCREGEVPTSKIYRAMEKLSKLGLIEMQPTRPRLFSALPGPEVVDRLIEISRDRARVFAEQAEDLRKTLGELRGKVRGRTAFVDLALGIESHVKRHLVHLAAARRRIWSYMEAGDLTAIDQVTADGFPILRRIGRNASQAKVDHRIVFGFGLQTAPQLLAFFRAHGPHLEHATGLRYSGELGHPFHVVDDDTLILSLDHPFIPEGRFASLLVRDKELVQRLGDGFETLWSKAMRDLREIDFHPAIRK